MWITSPQTKIGNTNGSSHALQDMQEKQALGETRTEHGVTRGKTNDFKSKFACILEASESTRLRMEESLPNYHEDHLEGKGDNSLQHYNVVHKIYSNASSNENSRSRSSSG